MHKEQELHYIKQGEVFISEGSVVFKTTLGSCVSVCLWDPYKKLGGINHYIRPLCNGDGTSLNMCGEHAIQTLIDGFLARGSRKSQLRAGVFGGCRTLDIQAKGLWVGQRNIDMAYEMLEGHGIRVIESSTGANHGLSVYFNTHDGSMRTKKVRSIVPESKKHKAPADFLEKFDEHIHNFNKAYNELKAFKP